ncbi:MULTISPECIES: hypothetical protein [Bacillaceae]|uniref:hypothetical protein n=1 Tax=Bacillaceae TaxID=186817 RepID=UPI00087EE4DF|nr:hypothetical protein [Bacillus sp. OK048]SDN44057.1 hypothetical protein SAMN05443253_1124 [Bacillus sp. OK048]
MSNKNQNSKSVADGIKETAGAAFHTLHSALETTENVAMNTVDAAKNVVNNVTRNGNEKGQRNHD